MLSNAIRIFPTHNRTVDTGTNLITENNLAEMIRNSVAGLGPSYSCVISPTEDLDLGSLDAISENDPYLEFLIYGYYIKAKVKDIINSLETTPSTNDQSYVKFVTENFSVPNTYSVSAMILLRKGDGDSSYTYIEGGDNLSETSTTLWGTNFASEETSEDSINQLKKDSFPYVIIRSVPLIKKISAGLGYKFVIPETSLSPALRLKKGQGFFNFRKNGNQIDQEIYPNIPLLSYTKVGDGDDDSANDEFRILGAILSQTNGITLENGNEISLKTLKSISDNSGTNAVSEGAVKNLVDTTINDLINNKTQIVGEKENNSFILGGITLPSSTELDSLKNNVVITPNGSFDFSWQQYFNDNYGDITVVGANAYAVDAGTAIGCGATTQAGVAIGTCAITKNNTPLKGTSIAIGTDSNSNGVGAIAIGGRAESVNEGSIAIGESAHSTTNSIAIGSNSCAVATNSIQLGKGTNSNSNSIQFKDITLLKDGKIPSIILPEIDRLIATYDPQTGILNIKSTK